MECPICCENYNQNTRKSVECPNPACQHICCKKCVRTYIVNTIEKPHCMSCKNTWDLGFCNENLNRSFMDGDYKNHRKKLLYDVEKSKMPATMPMVEEYLDLGNKKRELDIIKAKREEIAKIYNELKAKEYTMKNDIARIKRGKGQCKDKRVFIKPCPVNDCKGYLSTSYKCGLCNTWTCSKCHEVIGLDKNSEHVCNENSLKTVEMLKKDTKPCPGCGAGIFKISGCDQMFCTKCNIPFSWKTGKKVTGVIHNPHYYQWQKEMGGNAQVPGAVQCGGIPAYWYFKNKARESVMKEVNEKHRQIIMSDDGSLNKKVLHERYTTILQTTFSLHRAANHFQQVDVDDMRGYCQSLRDNQDLRIKYMCKEITEKKLINTIMRRDKQYNKKKEILEVYEVYLAVVTDSLIQIYNNMNASNIITNLNKCWKVIDYCNTELIKIGEKYSNAIGLISHNFYLQNKKRYASCWKNMKFTVQELDPTTWTLINSC